MGMHAMGAMCEDGPTAVKKFVLFIFRQAA
jgi:hypothetical protein